MNLMTNGDKWSVPPYEIRTLIGRQSSIHREEELFVRVTLRR